ncbi:hypothetical protein V6N12_073814 [Hibiscus sabdariffa]|uniref:RNase H type-1 domain-containing protein n=1 Tax=Hibiscus sabdariffa TaxID=183260 RepID=A0ABR2BDV7_9ROSI
MKLNADGAMKVYGSAGGIGGGLSEPLDSCDKSHLVVESDCKSTLEWISNPSSCPTSFRSVVQCIVKVSDSRYIVFKFIPRNENVEVDRLAKEVI